VLKTLNLKIKLYHYSIYLFSIILTILAFEIEIIEQIEYIYNISLLIVINYILGKYQKELKNYYTNLQSKSLDWIQIISFIFLGFNAFWIIEDILSLFVNYEFQMFPLLSMLGTMFVVFWVAKSGLKQSDIFSQEFHDYTKSGIKTSLDNEKLLWNSVEKKIKKDEIFLNPKLNLKQLSDSLNINEKELSKLINKHSQTNFFNYINKFRVEYFKESINQNKIDNLSILGIAMESGFNSKSTFYTAFKNIENCSPSQFLKKNNKSE
jgi:AraC-like DNA-binding protein